MPSIWRTCFDPTARPIDVQKMFFEPLERTIFEKIREDGIEEHNRYLIPRAAREAEHGAAGTESLGYVEGFDFLDIHSDAQSQSLADKGGADKESAIILVHWIGTFINTCFFP